MIYDYSAPLPKVCNEWRLFVRTRKCFHCGKQCTSDTSNDPNHRMAGRYSTGKVSDFETFSLCRICHIAFHDKEIDIDEWKAIALTLLEAVRLKVFVIDSRALRANL